MQRFLHSVLEQLVNTNRGLEQLTYVVPSKRAATFLKNTIAGFLETPVFSPDIYSVEDFIAEIADLDYASNTELLFDLYAAYLSTTSDGKDDFNTFLKWGQTILQDFNEINRYLINETELFSYLTSIQKLKYWGVQDNKTELIANYIAFWKSLPDLYSKFNAVLLEKNTGYQGLVYRHAHDNVDTYLRSNSKKKYVFIGFNALNKAESNIIQAFLSSGNSDIFFDIDNYFLEDYGHSASYFIRQYKKSWPYFKKNPIQGSSNNYLGPKSIKIVGVPKSVSQGKYVGNLLEILSTKNPQTLKKAALVLADENLLSPILHSIPKSIDQINITMGLSINNSTLSNFFETLFTISVNKSSKGIFYKEVLKLLSNPYSKILLSEDTKDHSSILSKKINKNNWLYVTSGQIQTLLPKDNFLSSLMSKGNTPGSLIKMLQAIVNKLKESLVATTSNYDLEVLYHCHKILNQIQLQLKNHSFISDLKSLKSLFFELLKNESLDFRGDPIEGLQVMGMLESRVLDFETVIITSVNEGILPSGKSNNSFIPYDVKKEFGMPTYREKDAIYTYHFYRLLQRAKNIYLIYNTEPDVLEGGEKSRFLTQLLTDEKINRYVTHTIASPTLKGNSATLATVQKSGLLIKELRKLAADGLSPTSLSNYIRNPMAFYKWHVLGIEPVEKVEEHIAHNTFGTIVHDSLEDLYRPWVSKKLTDEGLLALQEKIPNTVAHHILKKTPTADLTKGKNLIIYNVIKKYIKDFIQMEIEQVRNHEVKILAIEEKCTIELSVPSLDFPIRLTGKLDRVDEIDGQLRILDYKTGNVSATELEIMDWDTLVEDKKYNKAFQLLCYALLYGEEKTSVSFKAGIVPVKKLSGGILYFATKPTVRGTKNQNIDSEVLNSFKVQLERLVLEIFDPNIPFQEKED